MGRDLKRVSLDFEWPLNKIWKGYQNPHYIECPEVAKGLCKGGQNAAGWWFDSICRLFAMIGREAAQESNPPRYGIYPHPWLREWGMAPHRSTPQAVIDAIPDDCSNVERFRAIQNWHDQFPHDLMPFTPLLKKFIEGIAGEEVSASNLGHDASWAIHKRLTRLAGLKLSDFHCKVCNGHGVHPDHYEASEKWKPKDPPTGPGYQVWETVSEGSPISPVFATEDDLSLWLRTKGYSEDAIKGFLKYGNAPSMIMNNTGGKVEILQDIESCR